jgi:putative nucleotidyltransferase with HDIG domain
MIALLKQLADEAIANGYNAFGITGEISWVLDYDDGFERIMNYEYLLNEEIFGSYPVSAICRYNINKFSNSMLKNIIEVHPIIIWKGQVHDNPFYFSVINTENIDIEKYQLDSMLKAIENFTIDKSRFRDTLEIQELKYQKLQLNVLKNMVFTLTGLLGIHDKYTENHSQNVANLARSIAENMNFSQLEVSQIYYAGLVHDIGKALIPVEIITKNGKLTKEEYDKVKEHPTIGYRALSNSKELTSIAKFVLSHHERWDGKGYPNGLKEEEICIESRILAIADSFDAMTTDRPYRKAFSIDEAINEIENNIGNQFDPEIARVAIDKVFKKLTS